MRSLFFVLSALSVMALAFWVYQENHRTREALAETKELQNEIGQMRETLGVLRAEWAYLNRPDRLRELAAINYDRLGLVPLRPEQFQRVSNVSYPAPDLPPIMVPIDVMSTQEGAQ